MTWRISFANCAPSLTRSGGAGGFGIVATGFTGGAMATARFVGEKVAAEFGTPGGPPVLVHATSGSPTMIVGESSSLLICAGARNGLANVRLVREGREAVDARTGSCTFSPI